MELLYKFCYGLTALLGIAQGLFVLYKNPRSRINVIWGVMSFMVAAWAMGTGIYIFGSNYEKSLLLCRLSLYAASFIPVFSTHFCLALLNKSIRESRLGMAGYIFVIGLGGFVLTPWFVPSLSPRLFFHYYVDPGPLFVAFTIQFFTLVFYSHWLLFKHLSHQSQERQNQIKYVALGTIVGYACGSTTFLLAYGIPLNPLPSLFTPIYFAFITYAIVKHRLMDINIVLRRGLLASIVGGFLVAGYFGLIYAAERLFKMGLLQHHILALALTALTMLGVGLLVFIADPKRRLNQIFGVYTLTISWWALTEFFLVGAKDQVTANLWSYIEWPGVMFIAPAFLHTVYISTGQRRWSAKLTLLVSYVSGMLFSLLHLFTGLISAPPRSVGYAPFHNKLVSIGALVPLVFVILVSIALWWLWQAHREETGQRKTQLKYLFWASVIGYIGGAPDWFFPFGFYVPFLNPFGIYGVPCYSIAMAYAVLHHRLFNVNLVIRKSLVYSLLLTLLTVGYFGFIYAVERLFQVAFGYHSFWISLGAFALMALAFQPLKVGIQQLVDWLMFRAPHEELVRRMERLEQEIRHSEKLKAVSTLAAGMAHEIKNPLTTLKTFAAYLPEKAQDPIFQEKFQRIITQEVNKIDQIVRQVLDFAKPAPPQLQPTQVSQLLDETLDFLSNECLRKRIQIERSYADAESTIQADQQQLRQVFLNLLLNSVEAIDGNGGTLTISTTKQDSSLTVTIQDTGQGIPREHLNHIFDPFFTTKPHGTGLGLSIVHSIISEHGGTITLDSQVNYGTCCSIIFPLNDQTD